MLSGTFRSKEKNNNSYSHTRDSERESPAIIVKKYFGVKGAFRLGVTSQIIH